MSTTLSPEVLRWARTRAGLSSNLLAEKLKVQPGAVDAWEESGSIDEKLVTRLAEKTRTPLGYLFLPSPPPERLPISDFRRVGSHDPGAPSRALLSVIYRCQRRQSWYREYLLARGDAPLTFVGSVNLHSPIVDVAQSIGDATKLGPKHRHGIAKWDDTISHAIEGIEDAGILVNKIGYADGNTRNTLSVDEFRGFALSDLYAPLVFVNGADAPSAQMFTLAHEVAHVWLGESAVSNLDRTYSGAYEIEKFCNAVAAEVLVPLSDLKARWDPSGAMGAKVARLAKVFKVSRLVLARRAADAGLISGSYFGKLYAAQVAASSKAKRADYYKTKPYEASRRFSAAIIRDAKIGNTMFREAMELLGIKNNDTFQRYAAELKITV